MLPWCAGPVSDKDKPKPARLQAPQPAQPHAAYSLLPDAKSAPQRVESSHRGKALHGAALHFTCGSNLSGVLLAQLQSVALRKHVCTS